LTSTGLASPDFSLATKMPDCGASGNHSEYQNIVPSGCSGFQSRKSISHLVENARTFSALQI
jgi:hypothetical protein